MKKLNKNFQEQRKSVEAMLNMCANNTCVCDYPDTCNCSSAKVEYNPYIKMYDNTKGAVDQNLKHI